MEEGWKPLNTRLLASFTVEVELLPLLMAASEVGLPLLVVASVSWKEEELAPLLAAASSWLRKLNSLPVIRRLSTLNFWINAWEGERVEGKQMVFKWMRRS